MRWPGRRCPSTRIAARVALGFGLVAVGCGVLIASPPRPAVAAVTEGQPTLVLTGTKFSVPVDEGFAATLELRGLELPNAAFDGPPPTTTNEPNFPTTYLVTATVYDPLPTVEALEGFSTEQARAIEVKSIPFDSVATPIEGGARIELAFDGTGTTGELRTTEPGLYPIRIAIVRDGTAVATTDTYFEVLSPNPESHGIVTARIVARLPDIGPDPDQKALDSAVGMTRRLTRLANGTDQPVSAFIAPSVVTFLARQHPDLLANLVSALEGETVIPLPATFLPADTALDHGLGDTFVRSLDRGRSVVSATFPDSVIDTSVTVLDAGSSADGLALWSDNGAATAVIPWDVYDSAGGSRTDYDTTVLVTSAVAGNRMLPVAVVSPSAQLLSRPLDDDETPTSRAAELLAFVAAVRAEGAPDLRTLLLTTPMIDVPNPDVIAAVAASTDDPSFQWGRLGDISQTTNSLFANGSPVAVAWNRTLAADFDGRLDRVQPARLVAGDALSMLPADDERRSLWPWALDDAMSTIIDDDQAIAMIDDVTDEAAALKAAVSPPDAFKFTLTGSDSTLRFQLTNTSDTPLTVVVIVTSDRLSAPSETTVDLAPSAVSDVAVDVVTRSNGTANLRIALRTPAGNPLSDPVTMTGRVNTYSGLGQLFSVGALLVLTTWWVTHIRRRRRLNTPREDPAQDDPAQNGADGAANEGIDHHTDSKS